MARPDIETLVLLRDTVDEIGTSPIFRTEGKFSVTELIVPAPSFAYTWPTEATSE